MSIKYYGYIALYGSQTTYSVLLGRYFTPFLYFPDIHDTDKETAKNLYIREFGTTRITNLTGQAVVLNERNGHLWTEIVSEAGIPLPFFRKLVGIYNDLRIEYKFSIDNRIMCGTISDNREYGPHYFHEDGDIIMN